jgi:hypothetical protein
MKINYKYKQETFRKKDGELSSTKEEKRFFQFLISLSVHFSC